MPPRNKFEVDDRVVYHMDEDVILSGTILGMSHDFGIMQVYIVLLDQPYQGQKAVCAGCGQLWMA